MKDRGILHPQLARIVASMGHGDLLAIGDAGLPVPPTVERVDLAVAPTVPRMIDVLAAVVGELRVEAYLLARETADQPEVAAAVAEVMADLEPEWLESHEELKARLRDCRAVVRTGEYTPYANVLLRSGVDFAAARGS